MMMVHIGCWCDQVGAFCLGVFDNGSAGTLLGGITFRNLWVQVGTCCCRPVPNSGVCWQAVSARRSTKVSCPVTGPVMQLPALLRLQGCWSEGAELGAVGPAVGLRSLALCGWLGAVLRVQG